jgi:hypothetical protein
LGSKASERVTAVEIVWTCGRVGFPVGDAPVVGSKAAERATAVEIVSARGRVCAPVEYLVEVLVEE